MKKTLIALAVLAASGAAMAQSTFTLYGIADANLAREKGGVGGGATAATNSVNKIGSGGLNGSRWGLRGSEDLGGGLKGVFTLESGYDIDTGNSTQNNPVPASAPAGTPASGRLFGRQAFVGLEGGFGSVRLGRQYTPIGNASDLVGTKGYDILPLVGTVGSGAGYRTDNAATYKTPSFGGFTAELQYSTQLAGAEINSGTSPKQGRNYGFNAIYANGPITAGVGYINQQDVNATIAGSQKRNEVLGVAGYDLGVAKLVGFYVQTQVGTGATQAAKKMRVTGLTAAFPFGAATITPGFAFAKDVNGSNASGVGTKDDLKVFTLQGTYDLSKRTAVYAHLAVVGNEAATSKGFNTPNLDQTSNGVQLGVRHKF